MDAMSNYLQDSSARGRRVRRAGFTLIEMMFTVSLAGIVMAIALPSFSRMNADIRTRVTAEQLAGALRLAKVSAVTRNRPAALVLTDASPGADAVATANGRNWLVRLLPTTTARDGARVADVLQVATVALQNHVTLTGPAQVCFDALGMQTAAPVLPGSTTTACAQPGSGIGGSTSYLVSRPGTSRQFKVRVYRNGRVDICEAGKDSRRDPDDCL
jgi:type IV fimbrial biogenesis protein FimT